MNLIDAIKSGRPWREKGGQGTTWWKFDDRIMVIPHPEVDQVHTGPQYRSISWALEQDYEIQEPTVKITRAQFWGAVYSAQGTSEISESCRAIYEMVARRLGLEDL
jgi:hypothetical protein